MLSFSYRILLVDESKPEFEICEVWSNPLPFRYTKTGIKGSDLDELKDVMWRMQNAFSREFLYGDERFPEVFDYDEFAKQQKE